MLFRSPGVEDGVVLCDRPSLLALDAGGRLHSERGPAVRYRDGWAVWARHGEPAASNRPLARLQPPAAGPSGSSRS